MPKAPLPQKSWFRSRSVENTSTCPVLEILCLFRAWMQFPLLIPFDRIRFTSQHCDHLTKIPRLKRTHAIPWLPSDLGPFHAIFDSEQRFECDIDLCSQRVMIRWSDRISVKVWEIVRFDEPSLNPWGLGPYWKREFRDSRLNRATIWPWPIISKQESRGVSQIERRIFANKNICYFVARLLPFV
jgi:hypothetical protein